MKKEIFLCFLIIAYCTSAYAAESYLETWDSGEPNGWTANTVVTTVEGIPKGGNPGGWLFSYRDDGTMDIGAATQSANFTGDYGEAAIRQLSVDILLLEDGLFDQAWIRFRYAGSSENGWRYPLNLEQHHAEWQTFVVSFNPTWSDEEAREAGWVTDADVNPSAHPSVPFAITMAEVYTAEVRLSGEGPLLAGIDNFHISSSFKADHFEPNDEFSKAIDLGTFNQSRAGLNLHRSGEEDWYRWNAISSGELTLDLNFLHNEGDLDLEIYNANNELLASSNSNSDNEKIELAVAADQQYYFRVFSHELVAAPLYDFDLLFGDPVNYAVLFAGGLRVAKNFDRYYNNVKNLYEHLVDDRGLDPDNIYVLYADGTDDGDDLTSGGGTSNSDMSYAVNVMEGTGANLEDVLVNTLSPIIDMNDHFFLWTFDHGDGTVDDPDTTGEEELSGWNVNETNDVADEDLTDWLNTINAGRYTLVFGQCFAGGMLDNLEPLSFRAHGSAATNHYEYSWGDGFVAAYLEGLQSWNNSHDVYQYAYDHDGYATDGEGPGGDYANGVEHPWEATSTNFPIFADNDNGFPWMIDLRVIPIPFPWDEIIIPYELISIAAEAGDPELKELSFRIESVDSGMLFKSGDPVVPGQTLIGPGESLTFMPLASPMLLSNAASVMDSNEPLNAFTVRAFDGMAVSDRRVAVPLLFATERPLQAVDDSLEILEDSVDAVVDVLANDEGQSPLQVLNVGKSKHGTVKLDNNQVFYSPAAELAGVDSFIYLMADSSGNTDWATASITIEAVNDPPVAHLDEFSILINSTNNMIDVLDNDYDPESKPLTYFVEQSGPYPISAVIINQPSHGTLVPTADGRFLYTPVTGFVGVDLFTYMASDGEATSSEVQVSIEVSSCPAPCTDNDGDGYGLELDCDDTDPAINPDGVEICDNADNNCNGQIDESGYHFSEFLRPINADGSSVFKAGRTIPVKISLADCAYGTAPAAILALSLTRSADEHLFDDAGDSNSSATLFRYDGDDEHYIYNLSTRGMSAGEYEATATSENGQSASVKFSLQ